MSPLAVLKTLWKHKMITLPVLFITIIAGVYVLQFAPRSYDSTMTYALINPSIPTQEDIIKDPALEKLNSNNPYLRSSDPSLIVQVVVTTLSDPSMAEKLVSQGLSDKYTVARSISGQSSFLIDIVGTGPTPQESLKTAKALGKELEKSLYSLQKVNGASDQYTYTSLVVVSPDRAVEQFSSRLRSLVVVLLGGVVLMFGAVSVARAVEQGREKKKSSASNRAVKSCLASEHILESEQSAGRHIPTDIYVAGRAKSEKPNQRSRAEDPLRRIGRSTASGDTID